MSVPTAYCETVQSQALWIDGIGLRPVPDWLTLVNPEAPSAEVCLGLRRPPRSARHPAIRDRCYARRDDGGVAVRGGAGGARFPTAEVASRPMNCS